MFFLIPHVIASQERSELYRAVLKHGNIDFKKKAIVSFIKKSRRIHEFPLPTVLLELIPKGKNSSDPLFPELYNESRKKVKDNLAKPRKYMQALLTANGLQGLHFTVFVIHLILH